MSQWTDYSLLQINFLFSYLNNCISSVFLINKLIINYLNIPIPNGTHLYMSHLLSISWVLWFCFVTISLLSSKCVWLMWNKHTWQAKYLLKMSAPLIFIVCGSQEKTCLWFPSVGIRDTLPGLPLVPLVPNVIKICNICSVKPLLTEEMDRLYHVTSCYPKRCLKDLQVYCYYSLVVTN